METEAKQLLGNLVYNRKKKRDSLFVGVGAQRVKNNTPSLK